MLTARGDGVRPVLGRTAKGRRWRCKRCVGEAVTRRKQRVAAYRAELEKCVLVCANCHGEIEAGLLVGPPAGARYQDVLHIYGGPEPEGEP